MTDDELRQFVLGVVDGHIFTSAHIPDDENRMLSMVFMPLLFAQELDLTDVGIVWEWVKDAGPRGINGMPCFFSMRLMKSADWARARAAIIAETDRRKSIPI